MLPITDLRGQASTTAILRRVLSRGAADVDSMIPTVKPIVNDVVARGVEAAMEYSEKSGRIRPVSMRVPAEVIDVAEAALEDGVRSALQEPIGRVRTFYTAQKPNGKTAELLPGDIVREKWIPISRVGLYAPGGNAVYPSSALMNIVPAQEAGVEPLVVASPPQADNDGWPHPTTPATCKLLDVIEVWTIGGAQAVTLLAYGDENESLGPADMATGPGDIFVTAAKRPCHSVVDIDAETGPIEIATLASNTADPVSVTCDLVFQAEHDVMAASVLITDDADLAATADREVGNRYEVTMNADRVREAFIGDRLGIVLVDDMDTGVQVADVYTVEYLEIHTENAWAGAEHITDAGAIFIGHFPPVPLGDYSAGSNYVLPTSGTARHASDLSTHTFLRSVHMIDYNEATLKEVAGSVAILVNGERLSAHGEVTRARFETPLGSEINGAKKGNN